MPVKAYSLAFVVRKIGGLAVETVEDFCYLGSFLMNNISCDKDCQTRIGKATSVFEASLEE